MFIKRWNIKGLNDPIKHSAFCCLLQKHLVAPSGLVETHVREVNKDNVSTLLFQNWAYLFNTMIILMVVVFRYVGTLMC
jgi:hypothetical protein